MLPIARKSDLSSEDVAGETLVYDLRRHRAHCLNSAASAVWRYCDGQTTVAEMAAKLDRDLGLPADEALVRIALKQLQHAGLIEGGLPEEPAERLPTRREIAKRLAIPAALALPLVSSIAAPTPAAAASSVSAGGGSGDGPAEAGRGNGRNRKRGHAYAYGRGHGRGGLARGRR